MINDVISIHFHLHTPARLRSGSRQPCRWLSTIKTKFLSRTNKTHHIHLCNLPTRIVKTESFRNIYLNDLSPRALSLGFTFLGSVPDSGWSSELIKPTPGKCFWAVLLPTLFVHVSLKPPKLHTLLYGTHFFQGCFSNYNEDMGNKTLEGNIFGRTARAWAYGLEKEGMRWGQPMAQNWTFKFGCDLVQVTNSVHYWAI